MKSSGAESAHTISLKVLRVLMYGLVAVSALGFAYITYRDAVLVTPSDSDSGTFFITNLSYIVFEILVWVVVAHTALHLKAYSRSVIGSPDGQGLDYIANALLLLVPYSILISVGTNVKLLFVNTSYSSQVAAVANHVPLLVVLASAIYLFLGSRRLARLVPAESEASRQRRIVALALLALLSVTFARYFYAVAPSIKDDDGLLHYGLSAGVMLLTYVLPYVVVWLLGVLACLNLVHYMHRVKGVVYKRLFRDLYSGLLLVFICTFIVQLLLASQISTKAFSLQLAPVFGVILLLLLGYALIYRGVNQLHRLEE